MRRVHFVGKINREIFSVIAPDITTDEVIITDERIEHINMRRGSDFLEKYQDYFSDIIADPDYIFPDEHPNSALVCKVIECDGGTVNLVLRLAVTSDNPEYKNSILTAVRENKKRFSQRLRNNTPVYKKVDK